MRIVSPLRNHIEMRHRHHDHFVGLRNDLKGITSLMNHQVQHVMDDCACNSQDDLDRTDKKTQRANGDTHQQGGVWGGGGVGRRGEGTMCNREMFILSGARVHQITEAEHLGVRLPVSPPPGPQRLGGRRPKKCSMSVTKKKNTSIIPSAR